MAKALRIIRRFSCARDLQHAPPHTRCTSYLHKRRRSDVALLKQFIGETQSLINYFMLLAYERLVVCFALLLPTVVRLLIMLRCDDIGCMQGYTFGNFFLDCNCSKVRGLIRKMTSYQISHYTHYDWSNENYIMVYKYSLMYTIISDRHIDT